MLPHGEELNGKDALFMADIVPGGSCGLATIKADEGFFCQIIISYFVKATI